MQQNTDANKYFSCVGYRAYPSGLEGKSLFMQQSQTSTKSDLFSQILFLYSNTYVLTYTHVYTYIYTHKNVFLRQIVGMLGSIRQNMTKFGEQKIVINMSKLPWLANFSIFPFKSDFDNNKESFIIMATANLNHSLLIYNNTHLMTLARLTLLHKVVELGNFWQNIVEWGDKNKLPQKCSNCDNRLISRNSY